MIKQFQYLTDAFVNILGKGEESAFVRVSIEHRFNERPNIHSNILLKILFICSYVAMWKPYFG